MILVGGERVVESMASGRYGETEVGGSQGNTDNNDQQNKGR